MSPARLIPWPLLAKERWRKLNEPGSSAADIRQDTMEQWQRAWDTSQTGRWTHAFIPNVAEWLESPAGEISYYVAQVLTHHGNFRTYLTRIGKSLPPTCVLCPMGAEDDPQHTLFDCCAFDSERHGLVETSLEALISHMISSAADWLRGSTVIDRIMKRKEQLERERLRRFL